MNKEIKLEFNNLNYNYIIDDLIEIELRFSKNVSEFNFIKFRIANIDPNSEYNKIIAELTTDLIFDNNSDTYRIKIKADRNLFKERIYFFCLF